MSLKDFDGDNTTLGPAQGRFKREPPAAMESSTKASDRTHHRQSLFRDKMANVETRSTIGEIQLQLAKEKLEHVRKLHQMSLEHEKQIKQAELEEAKLKAEKMMYERDLAKKIYTDYLENGKTS